MDTTVERETSSNGGGGVEVGRRGIMGVVMVVVVGYLMMWIVMPTLTYKFTWLPYLRTNLQSTYFGIQGPQLLLYTFPVVFVAVLGSVYLHLGKKSLDYGLRRDKKEKRSRLATWTRPILVRGPVGILTGIELSFLIMFVALLVWSLATYLHAGFSRISPARIEADGGTRWKAKWEIVSYRTGLTGNICLTLLFFPVTRGSSILQLLGLTSERSIKYHMLLGNLVVTFFTAHGISYILYWASMGQISMVFKWNKVGVANVAGEITLLIGWILWATTFPSIRKKLFELFYYTHHLYILFVPFFILHTGISTACFMLPGFYLFIIDRYLRFLQSRNRVRLLSARALSSCQALELNFAKTSSLSYTPTSLLFVNVPAISKLQWHPFTITSSSNLEHDKLSVVIKVQGNWTRKLYDLVASSSIDRLQVSIEGPYGPPSKHFLRHDTLVMVSGGSGITPFFSIIRELLFASTNLRYQTPRLVLICVFKNASDLSMLDLLLPLSNSPYDISNLDLKINAYVTRDQKGYSEDNDLKQPRTIWFKPNSTDSPIYPNLGKNNWLWLGAIISSSFIGYLILMGIITGYYIYPIDQNTNLIFESSKRSVLNILILFISVAMAASGAVLWNKKRNAMEMKQITNMEGFTPKTNPDSHFYNADRELESLPFQSLLQSTQVQYGERPDLKKLLSDCKGSSVGVLVSGPHRMRREVAAICSDGLADNLHFESISFSW